MRYPCIVLSLVLVVGVGGCFGSDDEEDPECGNLLIEAGEMCDGDLAGLVSCSDLGLGQGVLTCTSQCQLDFSGCATPPTCGNDLRDAGEACDGTDLGGLTCGDLGYDLGALSCLPTCFYDLSACCLNGCQGEGDTRCLTDQVQACTEQANGCLDWQIDEDCTALSPAHVCDATTTDAQCVLDCVDGCTTQDEQRCDALDTAVQTCDLQASGCLDWADSEDCTPLSSYAFCTYSGGAPLCQPCLDNCAGTGDWQCDGSVLQECVEVVTGCFELQDDTDCSLVGDSCGGCGPGDTPTCFSGC